MVVRIARVLSACLVVVLLAGVRPAVGEGWSLPNPFASKSETKNAKPAKPVSRTVKKAPSTLDKIGTGTKNFFNKAGETLGLKKPAKKATYAVAKAPTFKKEKESKSLIPNPFKAEEPKKVDSVKDWMSQNKRMGLERPVE